MTRPGASTWLDLSGWLARGLIGVAALYVLMIVCAVLP